MEKDLKNDDRLSRRNIYTVPEGYFDKLEASIQARTAKKESPVLIFLKTPAFRLATAAACLVAAFMLWPTTEQVSAEELLSEVSDDQLLRYIEENSLPESDDILSYGDYSIEETSTIELTQIKDSIL